MALFPSFTFLFISLSLSLFDILTSNRDITGSLVLSGLSELLDLAGVPARIVRLGLADGQALLSLVARDEESNVRLADLDAVLVPLDPGVRVVDFALELELLLRDAVLALLKLLGESEFGIGGCKRKFNS